VDARVLLRECAPELEAADIRVVDSGWDCTALVVQGGWIFRVPRRPEVARAMEGEILLLRRLKGLLPLPVPEITHACRQGALKAVGHRAIPGEPLAVDELSSAQKDAIGAQLGEFLSALHSVPPHEDPNEAHRSWRGAHAAFVADCERRVLPLLSRDEARRAVRMFEEFFENGFRFTPAIVHADLGPGHILVDHGQITGIIDWTDARVGDPAIDLGWSLNGAHPRFARAVWGAYETCDDRIRERALFWHRLGPWHEVIYGLDNDRPELVRSGLGGVRARLP
jgi:aminoglycoside phosphotransferase (APT) family kinase protein